MAGTRDALLAFAAGYNVNALRVLFTEGDDTQSRSSFDLRGQEEIRGIARGLEENLSLIREELQEWQ
jgi:hypothetical protein